MFAFLDALETGLEAQLVSDAVTGVEVYTMPVGMIPQDNIQIVEVEGDAERLAMGKSQSEVYTATGVIFHREPTDSEASAKTVRTRCKTILGSVVTYVQDNPTIGSTVKDAYIQTARIKQGTDDGRWCAVEFLIRVLATF